jgi:hypothetical protein
MGLAPTTSTTMMLSLGDALAVALMERKGFSPDQYRDFHPGGSLGRALIRVADLMHRAAEIPLTREDASMREVLLVMAERRFGCVGLVDAAGGLCGIITDGDLSRHIDGDDFLARKASDIMRQESRSASCISMTVWLRESHEHDGGQGSHCARIRLVGPRAHHRAGGAALFAFRRLDEAGAVAGRLPDHRRGAGLLLRSAPAAPVADVL